MLTSLTLVIDSCSKPEDDPVEICGNGIDDDEDGYTDDADTDCQEQDCGDGVDNDGDGFIDCDDTNCSTTPGC